MKTAVLFPGQGAQSVGMGKAFYEACPSSKSLFDKAGEVLDFDLKAVCFEGPAERLNATDVCQPAILVTSLAIMEAAVAKNDNQPLEVDAVAGLSLGEYSALVFAGALSFEDGLKLVFCRGRLMQEACDKYPGGMISLMGTTLEKAQAIVDKIHDKGPVCIANLNAPGQVVLSGTLEALKEAEAAAREEGVKRAIPLTVAGAFHSPLMKEAADGLVERLKDVPIQEPRIPFYSNVTGTQVQDPEEIRDFLGRQVISPVLWETSMKNCRSDGIGKFIEPGPGKVLRGLMRKIAPEAECVSFDTP